MTQPAYMQEPWFAMLRDACNRTGNKSEVAAKLGVSAPTVYQVLNGSGLYGSGQASTARLADKVLHQLGAYVCPHLSEQHNGERVITADECRGYAHRSPPIGSPRLLAHWQACLKCEHRAKSAPPEPRPVVPRKGRDGADDDTPQTPPEETAS
jgi:hypothetical protein